MTTKTKTILAAALVIAVCGFIFFMSAKPAVDSDEISLGVVGIIIPFVYPDYFTLSAADQATYAASLNHVVRKCGHFTEFAFLGILVLNLFVQATRLRRALDPRSLAFRLTPLAACSWALSTLYAASDEIHQMFVPGRACMLSDVCIDSSGILVGILIACIVLGLRKRKAASRP